MLNLIFWTTFGFLIGWVGTILGSHTPRQSLMIPTAGIIGGIMGGGILQVANGSPLITSIYNPRSIIGACITAIVLVSLISSFTNQQTSR